MQSTIASKTTTSNTSTGSGVGGDLTGDSIADDLDADFVRGAARYLRRAGLTDDAIATSLVNELGIDLTDARSITLTL